MENKKAQRTTHNIKQLGFSCLRVFGSRFSILVGGQERSPKTQPFHIVKRYVAFREKLDMNLLLLIAGCFILGIMSGAGVIDGFLRIGSIEFLDDTIINGNFEIIGWNYDEFEFTDTIKIKNGSFRFKLRNI